MTSTLSRYKGSLTGGVVGDCIGRVFECIWGGPLAIERVLKDSILKVEAAAKNESSKKMYKYTDDTAMARCVVKSLIENNGLNSTDMAKRFMEEYHAHPSRGYGGGVITVFVELKDNNCEDIFGPASRQFGGEGSYGNGGAMRISPAALLAHHKQMGFDQLKTIVEDVTRLTHTHQGALHGAILQSYAVYLALKTVELNIDEFITQLKSLMKTLEEKPKQTTHATEGDSKDVTNSSQNASDSLTEDSEATDVNLKEKMPYCYKLEKMREFLQQTSDPSPTTVVNELGTDIAALDSVPAAIYSFLRATRQVDGLQDRNPFERTVIYAISLGGDTDTIATMAGAIAGAYYGIENVPDSWLQRCEGASEAIKDAENMIKLE